MQRNNAEKKWTVRMECISYDIWAKTEQEAMEHPMVFDCANVVWLKAEEVVE
tara:strand:+ start:195 stop:350 length:156 start_codon:yes stop_codon:yes gene_type:complete